MLGETNVHISTGTSFCIKAPYGNLENRSLQSPTFNKCGDWNIILSTFHHVINRLSGLGAHFKIVPLHSAGASKRLKVVTLRMRRYTCRERSCTTALIFMLYIMNWTTTEYIIATFKQMLNNYKATYFSRDNPRLAGSTTQNKGKLTDLC